MVNGYQKCTKCIGIGETCKLSHLRGLRPACSSVTLCELCLWTDPALPLQFIHWFLPTPSRLGGQAISWLAGKLETNRNGLPASPSLSDVQSRVLQATAKQESGPE